MGSHRDDDYEEDVGADASQQDGDGEYIVVWGVEVEFIKKRQKSHMLSARQLVIDHESVQIQLADGKCITYPIDQLKKVLVMRATLQPDGSDEIY